jgi:hypothetical protein
MIQLNLKNDIDNTKMSILLHLLKSWDIEAELKEVAIIPEKNKAQSLSFPLSAGMWADYDVNDKELREKAWGIQKNNKYDTL